MGQVHTAGLGQHPGVVDQNIDAAKRRQACIDSGLGTGAGADIGHAAVGIGAQLATGIDDPLQGIAIAVGQYQAGAGQCIGLGDGRTDSAGRARDNSAAPGKGLGEGSVSHGDPHSGQRTVSPPSTIMLCPVT